MNGGTSEAVTAAVVSSPFAMEEAGSSFSLLAGPPAPFNSDAHAIGGLAP